MRGDLFFAKTSLHKGQFSSPHYEYFWHRFEMYFRTLSNICHALRDLVGFVQFKKREKHLWKKVNFSKVAVNFSKVECY